MSLRNTPINHFVERVLRINAGFAGMGGASAGIIGASGTNEPMVSQLRSDTLAFAAACSRPNSDETTLRSLAKRIEGDLRAVRLINGLSDSELDSLLNELQDLLSEVSRT